MSMSKPVPTKCLNVHNVLAKYSDVCKIITVGKLF